MSTVWITNTSETALEDGCAGVRYNFAPATPLEVPLEVARHVFGYQAEDKEPFLARLGWCRSRADLAKALEHLSLFKITVEQPESKPASVLRLAK
jgi:hypothetical protein